MKRRVVKTKSEFVNWFNSFNGKMNCYTTVYDFANFKNEVKMEDSVILDRAFLDFDAHDEPLEDAWRDLLVVTDELLKQDIRFKMYFSGKGFHVFVYGEPVDDIRSIQHYYSKISDGVPTLDRTGIQTNRLRRVPNSMNLSSSDENGKPYYCIPLLEEDLQGELSAVLEMAKRPRKVVSDIGTELVVFPEMKPIEMSDIEVDIPTPVGKIPILPCLHNAIMVENPSHYARVYLVQWYRDLLSMGNRNPTPEQNKQITTSIMNELEAIASKTDIWLDWNAPTTERYVRGIVDKGYNAPGCNSVLIPQGFCVGKCWRYHDE